MALNFARPPSLCSGDGRRPRGCLSRLYRCGPQGAAALIQPLCLCYRRRCCRASSTRSSRSPYGELGRQSSVLCQAQFVEPPANLLLECGVPDHKASAGCGAMGATCIPHQGGSCAGDGRQPGVGAFAMARGDKRCWEQPLVCLPQFPSAMVALGRPATVQERTFSAPGFASSPNLSVNHLLPSLVFQATAKPLRHHHSRLWPAPKPFHPGVRDEVSGPVRVLKVAVLVGQSHCCTAHTERPLGERLLTLRGARSRAGRVGTQTPRPPQDSLAPQTRLTYFIL